MGGPATQIYIRGVGDFGSTPTTNPAVATNIDGVYVSRANSIEGNFFDIERLEVLKGPQGTLYGRNASGGALNIITAKPRLDRFYNHVGVELGNYNLVHVDAMTNIPLSDTFAIRAALDVVSRDGYSSQNFDDDHHESFRLSALWKPTDDFSLRVTADHERIHGVGPGYLLKGPVDPTINAIIKSHGGTFPTNPRIDISDPRATAAYYAASLSAGLCIPNGVIPAASATKSGVLNTGVQGFCPAGFGTLARQPDISDARLNNRFNNLSAEMNWNVGFATLTVVPGYRRVRNDYTVFPLVSYNNGVPERSDTYSLETRLGNSTPTLNWTAGLYYYKEKQNITNVSNKLDWFLSGDTQGRLLYNTQSEAAFGQATYNVADNWRIIAGGRYSRDHRTIDNLLYTLDTSLSFAYRIGGPCYLKAVCATTQYSGNKRWSNFTYKVGAEYDLTPQNMLFLTWATGEKSGGFSGIIDQTPGRGGIAQSYKPEKLGALEFGSRNRFYDSRLQVNVEGFYWKYKDAQETFGTLASDGTPAFGTTNAGQARMYGVDVDVTARVTPDDTIHIAGEYLNTRFNSFVFTAVGISTLTTACPMTPTATPPLIRVDCTGRPLTRSPKWSGTANYTHTFELASGAAIDAGIAGQYASGRYLDINYTVQTHAKAYVVGDLMLTYHNPDRKWSAGAFIRNFNNADVYTGAFVITGIEPTLVVGNLAAPRTYGVRLSTDF